MFIFLGEKSNNKFYVCLWQHKLDQKLETYVLFLCECWRFKVFYFHIFAPLTLNILHPTRGGIDLHRLELQISTKKSHLGTHTVTRTHAFDNSIYSSWNYYKFRNNIVRNKSHESLFSSGSNAAAMGRGGVWRGRMRDEPNLCSCRTLFK